MDTQKLSLKNKLHLMDRFIKMKKTIFTVLISGLTLVNTLALEIQPNADGGIFKIGEELIFSVDENLKSPSYTVIDWRGNVVLDDIFEDINSKKLIIKQLPVGYYYLQVEPNANTSFLVSPATRKPTENATSPFVLDSAHSWIATDGQSKYNGEIAFKMIANMLNRVGVPIVRDRIAWHDVEPTKGNFQKVKYGVSSDLLNANGVKVLGMYHDAPAWTGSSNGKLPEDLLATYNFSKLLAQNFDDKMGAWEFWNEQDIGFCDKGAWDYAANLKAAYLGFKSAKPNLPVLHGGIAHANPIRNFHNITLENGAKDYFDIFNFHTYEPLVNYNGIMRGVNDFMRNYGLTDKPIWITEIGTHAEGSGTCKGFSNQNSAHSPKQELIVGEFLPKSLVLMQNLGVERIFFFVFAAYNEQGGNKDWGILRRDYSVKIGASAYATLNEKVGNAKFLGSYAIAPEIQGFLYQNSDNEQTLIFWSKSELEKNSGIANLESNDLYINKFDLKLVNGKYLLTNFVGTPTDLMVNNEKLELAADRFPSYLTGDLKLIPTSKVVEPIKATLVDDLDKSIVFKVDLNKDWTLSAEKDKVYVDKDNLNFDLNIYNFSDKSKRVNIQLAGGIFEGKTKDIQMPAFGKTTIPFKFIPKYNQDGVTAIVINGQVSGDKKVSSIMVPVANVSILEKNVEQRPLANMMDPVNWHNNSSGSITKSRNVADNSITFDVKFKDNVDKWIYPRYTLQLPQESFVGAKGITFEIKKNTKSDINTANIMIEYLDDNGKSTTKMLNYKAPDENFSTISIPFDGHIKNPEQIRIIGIGMNPADKDFSYTIRNIKVMYQK